MRKEHISQNNITSYTVFLTFFHMIFFYLINLSLISFYLGILGLVKLVKIIFL